MNSRRTILVILFALLALSVAGVVLTGEWFNPSLQRRSRDARRSLLRVDQRQLNTAEGLAPLATTNREREFAQEVLRLADQDVDLAFAIALRHASDAPSMATAEAQEHASLVQQAAARVGATEAAIARMAKLAAKAQGEQKARLEKDLRAAQVQLALDQDDLAGAQRDLARTAGDQYARLQRALELHEKSLAHANANALAAPAGASAPGSSSRSALAEFKYWLERHDQRVQIADAQREAETRAAELGKQLAELEAALAGQAGAADAANETAPSAGDGARRTENVKLDSRDLADLDKRVEVQQKLAETYASWTTTAKNRELRSLHRLSISGIWIVGILLVATLIDHLGLHVFHRLTPDRVRLHTLRSIVLFLCRAFAVGLVLIVIFGRPSQMTTAMALAGAGLTVALKDFIVGFVGWFILIGRNGVRPGDWVEIKGVQGKVIELGLLYTIVLETGNWTASGHPTGRKVRFVNSYAIEGHYFNFSTSSQWLWDELQVGLPATIEPYPVVNAIRRLVEEQTADSARAAEAEWQKAALVTGLTKVAATATVSIRMTDAGYAVTVRYVARADERVQTRSKLNRAVFEMLAQPQPQPQPETVADAVPVGVEGEGAPR